MSTILRDQGSLAARDWVRDLSAETTHQLANPALDGLARDVFEVDLPAAGDPRRTKAILDFAADNLDFRKGAERSRTNYTVAGLENGELGGELALHYCARLGHMATTYAAQARYKLTGILGGFGPAGEIRLRFAQEQAKRGVDLGHVIMLGSDRPLFEDRNERDEALFLPEDAIVANEFDLLCAAAEYHFPGGTYEEEKLSAVYDAKQLPFVRRYNVNGQTISVLRAPQPDNLDRATTQHTFEVLRAYEPLTPETTVLLSTNARYRPFQHTNAQIELTLPKGARVETIGYDATFEDKGKVLRPTEILQEVKASVDALARLDSQLSNA